MAENKYEYLFEITGDDRHKLFEKQCMNDLAELYVNYPGRYSQLKDVWKQSKIRDIREIDARVKQRAKECRTQIAAANAKAKAGNQAFETDKNGNIKKSPHNIRIAIELLGVKLRYDEFAGRPLIEDLEDFGPSLDDSAMNRMWLTIGERFQLFVPLQLFQIVVSDYCQSNRFHPVKDYFKTLKWDGLPRLDTWLITYCKAKDTPYIRAVGAIFLMAGVRRIHRPGTKFDTLLVMEGPEGKGKSTALEVMAVNEDWYTDSMPLNADDKKRIESTGGKLIVEFGEMHGLRKAEHEQIKSVLSRKTDRSRLAYGRLPVEVPRQFIAAGTTNDKRYLGSLTGNRRMWPVNTGNVDLKALRRDRDQLWAEAVYREPALENLWLPEKLWEVAREEQAARELDNPFTDVLARYIGNLSGVMFRTDAWDLVGIPVERRGQDATAKLTKAFEALGFKPGRKMRNGLKQQCYVKETEQVLQVRTRPCAPYDRWVEISQGEGASPLA